MQLCDELTQIVLRLRFFNKIYAFCIFYWKLYLISGSTIYFFIGIRCLGKDTSPVLITIYFFLAFYLSTLWMVMYDKAALIPLKLEEFKEEIKFSTRKIRNKSDTDYIMKRIEATPNVGIRVGSFTYFEK